jgi:MinD superfamily P-loop ATPase
MKQVVFVSGKGGTGKTSVTAALAILSPTPTVMADLDVDAANLSLLFDGTQKQELPFMGQPRAKIVPAACTGCGQCLSACAFSALHLEEAGASVDPFSCEGCHACALVCPEEALSFVPHQSGVIHVASVEKGAIVHAEMGVAEDNSGKLVSEVRKVARQAAAELDAKLILLDGPPGIGCPVHAALNNVHLAVIVTEPSASGINDFERILQLCGHFGVPVAVVINKSTLAPWLTSQILNRCTESGIPVLGVIGFSKDVPLALSKGKSLLEVAGIRPELAQIHLRMMDMVNNDR